MTTTVMLDDVKPAHGDPVPGSGKAVSFKKARAFLKAVAADVGGRVAITDVKVKSNAGGFAVEGETSLTFSLADGRNVWAQICRAPFGDYAALVWRIGKRPYATDGNNTWIEERGTSPSSVANALVRACGGV